MRCVNCGWENPERARFCSNCGQALQVIVQENALGTQEDNEIEKELKIYDHAIKINPQNAVAWYNKGIVLGKLGRYQECKERSEVDVFSFFKGSEFFYFFFC